MSAAKKAKKGEIAEVAEAPDGKLKNKDYERETAKLHVELVKLQQWVIHKGLKVCIVFEGRTAPARAASSRRSPSASAPVYSASWHCPRRQSAKGRRCIFSATCRTSRRPARS